MFVSSDSHHRLEPSSANFSWIHGDAARPDPFETDDIEKSQQSLHYISNLSAKQIDHRLTGQTDTQSATLRVSTIHAKCPLYSSQLLVSNLSCNGGLIHVIDEMLMPSLLVGQTLGLWSEVAKHRQTDCQSETESVKIFTKLMQKTDLVKLLNDPSASLTVFAPTDHHLIHQLKHQQFNSKSQLRQFIASHIVTNATVLLNEFNGKQVVFADVTTIENRRRGVLETELRTMTGQRLIVTQPISRTDHQTETDDQTLVSVMSTTTRLIDSYSDVLCSNGVIHAIDGDLFNWNVDDQIDRAESQNQIGLNRVQQLLRDKTTVDKASVGSDSQIDEPESTSTSFANLLLSALLGVIILIFLLGLIYLFLIRNRQYSSINSDSVDDVIDEMKNNQPVKSNYGTIAATEYKSPIEQEESKSLINGNKV